MKRPLIASLLVVLAIPLSAQSTKYGPLALRLPTGARPLAMGNVAVAGRDDDVIFYNPSQLVIARGTSAAFGRMSSGTRGGTMSTVLRLGSGGVGLGVNYLEYRAPTGVYPVRRDDVVGNQPLLGTSTLATVGFAQVLKGLRLGVAAKYAVDQIGIDRFRNVLADVGVSRDFARYFTGGLAFQHLGRSMEGVSARIKPPMTATLGVAGSGPIGPLDVLLTTAASAQREGHVSGALGAEVGWSWLSGFSIAGRGGVRLPGQFGEARETVGFGFVADRLAIDFASEFSQGNQATYRVGFRIR